MTTLPISRDYREVLVSSRFLFSGNGAISKTGSTGQSSPMAVNGLTLIRVDVAHTGREIHTWSQSPKNWRSRTTRFPCKAALGYREGCQLGHSEKERSPQDGRLWTSAAVNFNFA